MADLIPFEEKDYLAEARLRVTEQFLGKPVFDKYLQLLTDSCKEVQATLRDLKQLRDIDSATGEQLNVIGRIVGQERELVEAALYEFFGFAGYPTALEMGEYGSVEGGYFYSENQSAGANLLLDDSTYRKFIKAKIFKNVTFSTPEELIQVVNLIFNTEKTYIEEGTNASFTIYFGRPLSGLEKGILDFVSDRLAYPVRLIPKTVGVMMSYNYTGIPSFYGGSGYGNAYGQNYGY